MSGSTLPAGEFGTGLRATLALQWKASASQACNA
jgi:hypothetical protein